MKELEKLNILRVNKTDHNNKRFISSYRHCNSTLILKIGNLRRYFLLVSTLYRYAKDC